MTEPVEEAVSDEAGPVEGAALLSGGPGGAGGATGPDEAGGAGGTSTEDAAGGGAV
jgi:hypothetical protein